MIGSYPWAEALAIWLVWAAFVVTPGPNVVVIGHQSAAVGRRHGQAAALGVALAAGIWSTAALIGLSWLVAHLGEVYGILRLVGAAYLTWLGLRAIGAALTPPPTARPSAPVPPRRTVRGALGLGIATSLTNPKAAVFFCSLFVVALPPGTALAFQAALALGIMAISLVWYQGIALAFTHGRVRAGYDRLRRWADGIIGVLLLGFAAHLATGETPKLR